ncbi:MAG: hypothetical protein M1820_007732 [Bogoriella megaspora]|nr:MAG: hypothetical protein M1820_007732 [Bogoriella megaspora]
MSPSMKFLASLAAVLSCVFPVISHPGEEHNREEVDRELAKRDAHGANIQRGLAACASKSSFRALKQRGETRRFEKAQALREKRNLDVQRPYITRRDLEQLKQDELINHNYTGPGYDLNSDPQKLFANTKNTSCILVPETTEGPYYITGEYFRTNVTEGQAGVPVHLEYQYIDVNTCSPIPGLYVDTWEANATGVYSGVVTQGNGDSSDASNVNSTFLRGVAQTDAEGVAAFDTLFPGHYTGRASHIHLITHTNGSVNLNNGTFSLQNNVVHVGQIYFDESLRSAVEDTDPYNTNEAAIVSNDDDLWAPDEAERNYDPFPEWAYLGDSVTDGLLMWISVGINSSANYNVSVAGSLTSNGGVPNPNPGFPGGGNGTFPPGPPPSSTSSSGSKKKTKKKSNRKSKGNNELPKTNGNPDVGAGDNDDAEEDEDLLNAGQPDVLEDSPQQSPALTPSTHLNGVQNGTITDPSKGQIGKQESEGDLPLQSGTDTTYKLDVLAKERDALRAEVTELRKSLEQIQEKHSEEEANLQSQLDETQQGKEHAEVQYKNLLGKVNTIRSQLGERLKADAEELSRARAEIDGLNEQNSTLQENNETLQSTLSRFSTENDSQAREISELRSRTSVSQQNWVKERDDLIQREAYAREEFENAKQAMQDWEVLAMEERSLRENLQAKVEDLEERVQTQREEVERLRSERGDQTQTVDGLQRALQDLQDARKRELRELVESSQSQLEENRKALAASEESSSTSKAELETTKKELERALPFEKEVKEKNLLIGKLRHEAVILNDHLTKALRFLKKGKPEDNVDRQIVTNHLLHFLALDRSDPKKFQVLQLIAALLGWSDEEREQAGLSNPKTASGTLTPSGLGTSFNSLRIRDIGGSYKRSPSTPNIATAELGGAGVGQTPDSAQGRESLAELWSEFLQREAEEGGNSRKGSVAGHSRRTSIASRKVSASASASPDLSRERGAKS